MRPPDRRLIVAVVLASCAKPPPPKPPPAELAAETVADLAGRWVTSDDMDWGYSMTIAPGGEIDIWIDRGRMGRCEQKGTLVARGNRVFRVTYTRSECNPQVANVPLDLTVASFTGASLTVAVAEQSRTYQRADDEQHSQAPSVQLH